MSQYQQQGGYPPQQGGYPPQDGSLTFVMGSAQQPPQQQYPPQQYPPQQSYPPPQQQQYPPQQQQYPPIAPVVLVQQPSVVQVGPTQAQIEAKATAWAINYAGPPPHSDKRSGCVHSCLDKLSYEKKPQADSIIPCFANFCSVCSVRKECNGATQDKQCFACFGENTFCCIEIMQLAPSRSAEYPRVYCKWLTTECNCVVAQEVCCCMPTTCARVRTNMCCFTYSCAFPCDDNVAPCMFTLFGMTCFANSKCGFACCETLAALKSSF